MIVIADTSPLIVLLKIELASILPSLFQVVTIPTQILPELKRAKHPLVVREFASSPPNWLIIQSPSVVQDIPSLHSGECAAISLAHELKADLLLIDELRGRRAAIRQKLNITGSIGVLEMAARARLIDLADAFERVRKTDFWISSSLLEERLRQFRQA